MKQVIYAISHPLLVLTYAIVIMTASNPFLFGAADVKGHMPFILIVIFSTAIIPILAVLLMNVLGMIPSWKLEEARSRIAPIFSTCVLYSAFYFNVRHSNAIPAEFADFLVGALITMFMTLFIHAFYRVSMHAAGLSNLVTGLIIFYFSGQTDAIEFNLGAQVVSIHFLVFPVLFLVMTGVVSSIQMAAGRTKIDEVLAGWMLGIFGQVLSILI